MKKFSYLKNFENNYSAALSKLRKQLEENYNKKGFVYDLKVHIGEYKYRNLDDKFVLLTGYSIDKYPKVIRFRKIVDYLLNRKQISCYKFLAQKVGLVNGQALNSVIRNITCMSITKFHKYLLYNFSIDDVGKIVEMYYKKQTE